MTMRIETFDNATLYLGDCRDVLPTLSGVDTIVTDPPYGISYVHGGGGGSVSNKPTSKAFRRNASGVVGDDIYMDPTFLLTERRRVLLWGANHFAHLLPRGSWLVWDKVPTGKSRTQGDGEAAWINDEKPRALRIIRHLWDGVCVADRSDISDGRVHPMQKPVAVMRWCIGFLPEAKTIADPFMGSGTTGLAALREGRSFIGIEIEVGHFDVACRRIEAASRQRDLLAQVS